MAIRNLLTLLIMAEPLFANTGRPDIGVCLIIAGGIGCNLARGIAIAGNRPCRYAHVRQTLPACRIVAAAATPRPG